MKTIGSIVQTCNFFYTHCSVQNLEISEFWILIKQFVSITSILFDTHFAVEQHY